MSVVTIEEAREQCEVIGTAHDSRLERMIAAAEAYVENYLNRSLDPWTEEISSESSSETAVPEDVKHAILLYVDWFFNQRGAFIQGTIVAPNPAADALLALHRKELGA